MVRVVAYPEAAVYRLREACSGPSIRVEAGAPGSRVVEISQQ
ncbi:MAG TPA: hypothetical protein VH640_05080 [Bryobacteraceae bacterium]